MKVNACRVLELLGSEPKGLTRAEIGSRIGLSKPTVQSIIAELRQAQRIVEIHANGSYANGVTGRPPERFVLTRQAGLVVGVDVGHGHIRVAVADRSGRIIGEPRQDVEIDVDSVGISALARVADLIGEALAETGSSASAIQAVAIGIPAAIDRSGRVLFSDALPSWATVDIGNELLDLIRSRFHDLDLDREMVRVENDANLGAVGEGWHGEAKDARHYLYLKASTGIGMGLVVRREIYRGSEAAAGEFGHVTCSRMAEPFLRSASYLPTTPCTRCGKLDCLENLASGAAILRQLQTGTNARMSDQTLQGIVQRATTAPVQFPDELKAIIDAGIRIGHTLTDVIRVFAPQVIVVGGLLAEAGDALVKPMRDVIVGTKGIPAVEIRTVALRRIRRVEVEGAVAVAARRASVVSHAP